MKHFVSDIRRLAYIEGGGATSLCPRCTIRLLLKSESSTHFRGVYNRSSDHCLGSKIRVRATGYGFIHCDEIGLAVGPHVLVGEEFSGFAGALADFVGDEEDIVFSYKGRRWRGHSYLPLPLFCWAC
jgi:hypothetical protein